MCQACMLLSRTLLTVGALIPPPSYQVRDQVEAERLRAQWVAADLQADQVCVHGAYHRASQYYLHRGLAGLVQRGTPHI